MNYCFCQSVALCGERGSSLHVGDAKVVSAGLDWCSPSCRKSTFKQSDMLLLVLGDEQQVLEEMLVKACELEVGLGEAL